MQSLCYITNIKDPKATIKFLYSKGIYWGNDYEGKRTVSEVNEFTTRSNLNIIELYDDAFVRTDDDTNRVAFVFSSNPTPKLPTYDAKDIKRVVLQLKLLN